MKQSFVFLANGFEETEALATVDIMRRAGMPVSTVTINETHEVTSAHDITVKADLTFEEADLSNAEWLILPGGMGGASNLAAHKPLCDTLLAQNEKGEKLAAICASPSVVFGPLGLLNGRNATCYPGMEDGMTGAIPQPDFAIVDDNITTGKGPAATPTFALTIVAQSMGNEKATEVAKAMLLM